MKLGELLSACAIQIYSLTPSNKVEKEISGTSAGREGGPGLVVLQYYQKKNERLILMTIYHQPDSRFCETGFEAHIPIVPNKTKQRSRGEYCSRSCFNNDEISDLSHIKVKVVQYPVLRSFIISRHGVRKSSHLLMDVVVSLSSSFPCHAVSNALAIVNLPYA